MKVLNYFALLLGVVILSLFSCEETSFEDPTPKGRMEKIYFEKDTFEFKESDAQEAISIVAEKYLNYSTTIGVELVDLNMPDSVTAVEGTHFRLLENEVKMLLGESRIDVPFRLINDSIVNPDRHFALDITSIEGGGLVSETKQRALVIIRNDDFIPEASVVFEPTSHDVMEDAGQLLVTFHLTKKTKSEVSIKFGVIDAENSSAEEGIDFNILDKELLLAAGDTTGTVKLEIIHRSDFNDPKAFSDNSFKLAITEVVGVEMGIDSICAIDIKNVDLNRKVGFSEGEQYVPEAPEGGIAELPLYFTGGRDDNHLVSGTVEIDSLFGGAAEGDIVIENADFTSAGDETIQLRFKIKDNKELGAWGARLTLRNLTNVRTANDSVIVNVIDDERLLEFETTEFEINEDGDPLNLTIKLLGGTADADIISDLIVTDNTTAVPEQYKVATRVRIDASASTASFTLTPIPHASKEDRLVSLRIAPVDNDKILTNENSTVNVTIKNTDGAIGFQNDGAPVLVNDLYTLPVTLTGFDQPVSIKFAVTKAVNASAILMDEAGNTLPENTLNILPGALEAYPQAYISRLANDETASIEVSIESISMGGKDVTEQYLNYDGNVYNFDMKIIENTPLDRSTWSIESFSTEEPAGEGANNGRAIHLIDDDEDTFWHSQWQGANPAGPHTIVIDMKKITAVTEVSILIRNDTKTVDVAVGNNVEWTPKGTITLGGEADALETLVIPVDDVVQGRYLQLSVMGKNANGAVANIKEVYVNGTQL